MPPYRVVFVDNEHSLAKTVCDISSHTCIAFDSEGENLGRSGTLTVATFAAIDPPDGPIYVVDVKVLGRDKVFATAGPSLRKVLEDEDIQKVTFDCRSDSDALFHQFGVKLAGVWDLQVFDQAVRIHRGERPPEKCPYVHKANPVLPNMDAAASRLGVATKKLTKPHAMLSSVWKNRPLRESDIAYAANDVQVIREMLIASKSIHLSKQLEEAVKDHCKRYECMFRDLDEDISLNSFLFKKKSLLVEECAIIHESSLPFSHPRHRRSTKLKGKEKWDLTIEKLRIKDTSNPNDVFASVMFILQHDDWYTKEAYVYLRTLCAQYPFSHNQRNRISSPPKLRREEEEDYDRYYSDDYDF